MGRAPGPGRGGGTAPTFPASGPVVRGTEPPEHCLPPSSSPPPPPRSATHNTRRKRKPRREARVSASRGVDGRPREGLAVPAEEEGGRPVVRICRSRQGRKGTWRGRWLKRGRPGDLRNPLEEEGHACAWLSAEAHCPQGADGRGQTMLSGPRSRSGSGWARLIPGGVGGRWGRAADFELLLSSAGQSGEKVAS